MNEIRIELDCGVEEAKRLLAEYAVTGFWPKLKAKWRRTRGPANGAALPRYAVRFSGGDRFVLDQLDSSREDLRTDGNHMLRGRLEARGGGTVLQAAVALATWDTFSVRHRTFWLLAFGALIVSDLRHHSTSGATFYVVVFAAYLALLVLCSMLYAYADRDAFARMLKTLFEGHVA